MGAVWDRRWGQIVTVRGVIVPDRLIPNSAESENNLFTNISNGSQEDRVCLNVFVPISQVWCQQPCSSCPLFADVVSELSEYWQTPGLSGMDTIYGPARVTASDLVKKWRISMQGGIKSRGTKMSVLINLHGDSKSMTKAFFFFFFCAKLPGCWMYPNWKTSETHQITPHTFRFKVWSVKKTPFAES